ncbi:MAG: RNA-binding S4 domain-containing protein [Proteobacteria bacterium]|nr:RNA-binding S4 domain-containing protein [Pseudomonadota bacterium]MBU1715059.1 RNA-binding S4 domain-containing protein [Pseudomonadota bacterium]
MDEFMIESEMIRLGQLLKAANLVSTGGEAKMRIQSGEVLVNGEVETRRGRQLHAGDQVALGENTVLLIAADRKP